MGSTHAGDGVDAGACPQDRPAAVAPELPVRHAGGWRRGARAVRWLHGALFALVLTGCAVVQDDLPYYWQSARGHFALMRQAEPIESLLERDDVDARLKAKLERVREIRAFAARVGLPDNGSFTRYAALDRPFVVWNVFATRPLSMQLRQWCFPVAGCVGYRGYFDRAAAERFAQSLRAAGWEAYVGGVPAYSTLGWFDDPVLSTFVHLPEGELARLVFHELAHQVVYVKDDSAFNESFATAVEEAGVDAWLAARGDPAVDAEYRRFARRRREFVALLLAHKAELEAVYEREGDDAARLAGKARVFESLQAGYRALRAGWGGYAGYDRWFAQPLTNAHLASVAAYTEWVPGFHRMLGASGGDLRRFFGEVRELARLDREARARQLASGTLATAD